MALNANDKKFYRKNLPQTAKYNIVRRLHIKGLGSSCGAFEEEATSPEYFTATRLFDERDRSVASVVSRTGYANVVAKVHTSGKEVDDLQFDILLGGNPFTLRVESGNKFSTIYESYIYNLEEVGMVWNGWEGRKDLDIKTEVFIMNSKLFTPAHRPTIFFRKLMGCTLEFLQYLQVQSRAYGGIHPLNIFILDEEFTIKFKKREKLPLDDGTLAQDMEQFVRLVRFCVHGSFRRFDRNDIAQNISPEAKSFFSIFDLDEGGVFHISRNLYALGFREDRRKMMKHPLFWDEFKCLRYFEETYNFLETCGLNGKPVPYHLRQIVATNFRKLCADLRCVDIHINVIYVMGQIRNLVAHNPDGKRGGRSDWAHIDFGSYPTGYWEALQNLYPKLLAGIFEVMLAYRGSFYLGFDSYFIEFYPM